VLEKANNARYNDSKSQTESNLNKTNNRLVNKMKNNMQLVILVLIAILGIIIVEIYSINAKYGLGVYEYIKYSMPLDEEEIEYLENNELIYGMDRMAPPLSYVDPENGQNEGMVVEFISQLSIDISKDIKYKPLEWSVLLNELNKGHINIADLFESEERSKKFLFTQPLYVLNGKILGDSTIKSKDLDEIINTKLAIVKGDFMEEMTSEYFSNDKEIEFIYTSDIREALGLLVNGEVNGIAGDETVIAYLLNDMDIENDFEFIEETLYTKNVCLATKKDNEILLDILNKGIMSLKKQNLIIQIQGKWFGDYAPEVMDIREYDLFTKILVLAILIVLFGILWNSSLARRVKSKTNELNEKKESLRIIVDTLHDGLLVVNSDNIVEECNDSVNKILKLDSKDIIGKNYLEIDELNPFVCHLIEETDRSEEDSEQMKKINNSYYLVTKRLYKHESNKMLIALADFTEKHINEQRARQESKMIAVGQLSAGLAHEIRNPLGLIRSYIFILDRHSQKEEDKHAVSVIDESVQRINGLIESLLSFSRLSKEEYRIFKIKKMVDNIVSLENKRIKNKKIDIIIDIPEELEFNSNEEILKMCIMNIFNNSIDSFEDNFNNQITIKSKIIDECHLNIKIIDNGIGIDEKDLENVFNPFFTTKKDGTGLGLYIISNELTRIDGKIKIESEKNIGTTIDVIIPLSEKSKR